MVTQDLGFPGPTATWCSSRSKRIPRRCSREDACPASFTRCWWLHGLLPETTCQARGLWPLVVQMLEQSWTQPATSKRGGGGPRTGPARDRWRA